MDYPLYMSVKQAAEYTGIGEKTLRCWLNSSNPMPYLRIGNKKLIQREPLAKYIEERQEVRHVC